MLMFYFDTDYDELFKTWIIPVEGKSPMRTFLTTLRDISVDTVINCAANVKHFSAGTDIEDVNIESAGI